MKKRLLSILLCLCLWAGLLPVTAFAAADQPIPDQVLTAPCDQESRIVVKFSDYGLKVKEVNYEIFDKIVATYGQLDVRPGPSVGSFAVNVRVHDEPVTDTITVTVKLSDNRTTSFKITVILTGKYIVNISGVTAMDAIYDGSPKAGYIGTPVGTLTSGEAYTGNDFEVTYTDAEGDPLKEAPTEMGSYNVIFAVPDTNETYKGSLTLPFRIIDPADAEASYQTVANGEWINTTFTEAIANVYAGGTVRLLKDISIYGGTVLLNKNMTITSTDSEAPRVITTQTDEHSYLLRVGADVKLEHVIVDGGSASGLTAARALIAVGDTAGTSGKMTLSTGSVVRNNNNTTTNGSGGGVCVINGECVIDGGRITGNSANSGGGISMTGTDNLTASLVSGSIDNNKATGVNAGYGYGGGVYINGGSFTMSGGEIHNNQALNTYGYGGGVMLRSGSFTMTKGDIYGNTAVYRGGAVYAANATVKLRDGTITGNSAAYGGAMYVSSTAALELTGGSITENTATGYAGGIEIYPEAAVKISGSPVVKGNTSSEETDGGMYFDYDGSGRREPPDITIGEMTSGAELHWYTWIQENLDSIGGRLLIAAPAEGRAAITAYDLSKQSYIDENYDLILTDGDMYLVRRIPATGIAVTPETLKMKIGDSKTLTAALTPADATCPVTWTSSDESVATVENGVVKAIQAGTVTITATVMGDLSDSCQVTVSEKSTSIRPPVIPPVTPPVHDCPSEAFSDVNTDLWYHEALDYVIARGLMGSVGGARFGPLNEFTRAQMWVILARLDGVETEGGATWYEKGRSWAMAEGVSDGTNPDAGITREQMVTMLWRYARYKGVDVSARADLSGFTDGAGTSSWAKDAVEWAVAVGLLQGQGGGVLNPTGTATRAEAAQIFMNYCRNILDM